MTPFRLSLLLAALIAVPLLVSAEEKAAAKAPEVVNGYLKVGFDRLASFTFETPAFDPAADPKAKPRTGEEQIPAEIKALTGKKAMVSGFMLPVKMVNGLVTEFLLVRDQQSCCYGATPTVNHWIMVKLTKGVKNMGNSPVHVYGQLKVGAVLDSSNFLVAIYSVTGDKVEHAPEIDDGQ